MGTTLTGTTPQDTYDSLIKVTDNGPIGATPKLLSDGLGNDSSLALSTSFTAVRGGQQLRVYRTDNATYGSIEYVAGGVGFKFDDVNGDGYRFAQGANARLVINTSGNVGIGTSSPPADTNLTVLGNFQSGFYRDVTSGDRGYVFNLGAKESSGALTNAVSVIGVLESTNASGYMLLQTRSANVLSTRVRIDSDGLKFGSDTLQVNALDDYEEGIWTPNFTLSAGSVSAYTSSGSYTKIGRQVSVTLSLAFTTTLLATMDTITGLPFAAENTAQIAIGAVRENSNTGYMWQWRINANGTSGAFRRYDNAVAISNGDAFIGTLTYFV